MPPIRKVGCQMIRLAKNYKEARRILIKDLKKNNIDYAIVIPDNVPDDKGAIPGLDTTLNLLKNNKRFFIAGTISILRKEEKILKKLDNLFKTKKIVAMKIFPGHDPIYPTDKRLIPVYKLCIKHNLPIIVHTGGSSNDSDAAKYNDPKYIIKIARRYPELKIVIAHYFWPKVEYCYKLTRGHKNIYFDTSALADKEVVEETGAGKIKKILEKTIRDNPESVLFGTDYACCEIKDHIKLINSLNISKEEKEKIFWKNAVKLFKLDIKYVN